MNSSGVIVDVVGEIEVAQDGLGPIVALKGKYNPETGQEKSQATFPAALEIVASGADVTMYGSFTDKYAFSRIRNGEQTYKGRLKGALGGFGFYDIPFVLEKVKLKGSASTTFFISPSSFSGGSSFALIGGNDPE